MPPLGLSVRQRIRALYVLHYPPCAILTLVAHLYVRRYYDAALIDWSEMGGVGSSASYPRACTSMVCCSEMPCARVEPAVAVSAATATFCAAPGTESRPDVVSR